MVFLDLPHELLGKIVKICGREAVNVMGLAQNCELKYRAHITKRVAPFSTVTIYGTPSVGRTFYSQRWEIGLVLVSR